MKERESTSCVVAFLAHTEVRYPNTPIALSRPLSFCSQSITYYGRPAGPLCDSIVEFFFERRCGREGFLKMHPFSGPLTPNLTRQLTDSEDPTAVSYLS